MKLRKTLIALGLAAATAPALAADIPALDHVIVIMMENHYISQILGNANAPFITSYAAQANLANNYFGVGHPSLTNYLEVTGGSNFGVIDDYSPDWHNQSCTPNIVSGIPNNEASPNNICPIAGSGYDAPTPAVDTTNEGTPQEPIYNDPIPSAKTVGRSIADQLAERERTWKSYQENLPPYGADGVNNSDGLLSDLTAAGPGFPKLYAVKHNPFVYFANVQEHGLHNVVDFSRLYRDLAKGDLPTYSLVVPNQCHDQHGRGSSEMGTDCSVDQNAIATGDAALGELISAIHASPVWKKSAGNTVIVTVWDENDYSSLPNQVVAIVDTNYGSHGKSSNVKYNHFSLLKTVEAGLGLPYLNHAADKDVKLMKDLFN